MVDKVGWIVVYLVCCPGFPLPALDCSLGFFVGRQGSLLAFTVGELDAFDALLALLSIFSGRRFLTSQPYSPLGWGHSLVVSSFALFTVSDFFWGWYLFGMTIEDVAEKADVWSEAIKKIVKAVAAAGVALATAIGALLAWWPSKEQAPPPPALIEGTGYGPQCSQLYNTIDHTWTEQQWTVWESLKRELNC